MYCIFGFIIHNVTGFSYKAFLTFGRLCCKIYVKCGSYRFPPVYTVTA